MAVGVVTRGTTNPNRLRRVDRWVVGRLGRVLPAADHPVVVDLGFGASPVTTVELRDRLRRLHPAVRVVGLEIDPARVAAAQPAADPPGLTFALGGFELAGLRPVLVRAMNVLRQYPADRVATAWDLMCRALAPDGVLVEGTCDEIGRRAAWVTLDRTGPRTLTLAVHLPTLALPSEVAPRLPKALIHRNVPGQPVHDLLQALDRGWRAAAPYAVFGPRQRWQHSIAAVRAAGWPVLDRPPRWRLGELTVAWQAVAPADLPGPGA